MGVAGLWELLRPAAKTRSLTELAIKEGFEANPDGKRGFRLGIDASIWFFHAEYGKEGENPVLRTLFFRCATLMHATFLPIFVFDGPKRPDVKRGKKINKTGHKLIPGMKNIIEAFGFEWRMAPGEAEAELAYLNRIGIIDGVLSDDVDNFLFGATTVVRNSSSTLSGNRANPALNSAGKEDKNHTRVFRLKDLKEHPDVRLTRGGMILIGLMAGGDYHTAGVPRCGKVTAHGLAKCGFGDSLYDAAVNLDREDLAEFIIHWREGLLQELRTNSKGEIGRKQAALANAFPKDFPDIDILLSYVRPITSESMGRESNNPMLTWSKEPDVAKLAATCEMYFEWGYKEAIIKRFRTVMWHAIVLRILRRAVLDRHDKKPDARVPPTTPRKSRTMPPCGTPSKMIAQNFSCLALETPRTYISGSESEDDEEERLIIKVHSSRTHTSTNGMLEYRLEIAPKQLVRLAEGGIQGLRMPAGPDEWASEGDDEDEDTGTKKRGKGQPKDPEAHMRVWMPACMVKIVEPRLVQEFEDIQEQKAQKKMKRGTKSSTSKATATATATATAKAPKKTKKPVANSDDEEAEDVLSIPEETKKKTKKPVAKPREELEDIFSSPILEKPKKKTQTVAKDSVSSSQLTNYYEVEVELPSSEDELPSYLLPKLSKRRDTVTNSSDEEEPVVVKSISKSEVIDLTSKRPSDKFTTSTGNLKSFFPVTKSLYNNKTTSKPSATSVGSSSKASTSTTCYSSDAPGPSKGKGSSRTSSSTTNEPLVKAGRGKQTHTAKQITGPVKVSKPNNPFAVDPNDSSCGEYDTTAWTKSVAITGSSITSPSKRKTHAKSSSSPSESESRDRVKKSPRKKLAHTSPQLARRPVSPSPGRQRSPALWKITDNVIDVSTDAESDNDLPGRIRPQIQSRLNFPSMKTKSKLVANSLSMASTSSKQSSRQKPHTIIPDIIDLT